MPCIQLNRSGAVRLLLPLALLSLSWAAGTTSTPVRTVPFDPSASLGGEFYRVTGETCTNIVGVTAGAASQLPASSTLVACLVYTHYSSALMVESLIAKGMKGSGYLLTNNHEAGQWAMLAYAGPATKVCENLVFGVREYQKQVSIGVFCNPNSGQNTKASTNATVQVGNGAVVANKAFQITDKTFANGYDVLPLGSDGSGDVAIYNSMGGTI